MYLIAGLGNPGPKYAQNRHNVGFMVVERFAQDQGAPPFREKFSGHFTRVRVGSEDTVLLMPSTFMNLSGRSVQAAMAFFKLELSELIVVHDELDLDFATLRLKSGGGLAGHNGLKSIAESCGGQTFGRLRVGIGRPRSGAAHGHVLGDFSKEESAELPDVLSSASSVLRDVLENGFQAAMNLHNRRS